MSYLVQKMDSVPECRDILGSILLNSSSDFKTDIVETTLTMDSISFVCNKKTLHRGSTFSPPSDNWFGWMSMFKLRRTSSTDGGGADDLLLDDQSNQYSVYCEQITTDKLSVMYKLFSSASLEECTLACESLKRTLEHFANTTIPMILLELLVLPQPKTLSELPKTIIDYLHSNCKETDYYSKFFNSKINRFPLTYHACVLDEVEVLECLLKTGADLFYEEPYTGNGLLHTAAKYSHSCLVLLLDSFKEKCSETQFLNFINKINHYNFDSNRLKPPRKMQMISHGLAQMNVLGLAPHRISPEPCRKSVGTGVTPLMLAAGEESIKSVGILLASGADPNLEDPSSGTTALHVAVLSENMSLVQMLVSFGADIDIKNSDSNTPLDYARKASNEFSGKCVELFERISLLRRKCNNVWGNGVVPKSSNKGGMYILSIDGGGTRALIPSYVLGFLEIRMRTISQKSDIQISKYFNWLSGTSAGSFIVLGMVYNSITPSRVLTSIIADRDKLFSGNRIYKEEGLEEFIKGIVGDEKYVDEIKDPKVIVPTTLCDRNPPQSVLITNYRKDSNDDDKRWKIHEAVHASAAAPTYFPAFEKKYVDGGLMVPNPTLVTMTEALNHTDNQSIGMVLSLGTGIPPSTEVNLLEVIYPRLSSFVSDIRHDLKYIHQMVDLLMANITNLGHSVAHAETWCKSLGASFYRLSPNLTTLHDLDSKDDSAMADIFYETYIYCLENAQLIENLACELLDNGPQHSM